nr:immunoglobulin heavy chain junction region [Macaca mulatta]MOV40689.1 immunoglobulin heavy chain junction region [Macaca mulatta]MOV40735.1 immunoglobulin heavy chain junction region [Macaca mulatta]MOV40931.1 immunoglobulin heavy chain junction region [Macaca mulatta]MOV42112.1 immunoglobulin heavy chain junction region [Macaca mulatta]
CARDWLLPVATDFDYW